MNDTIGKIFNENINDSADDIINDIIIKLDDTKKANYYKNEYS